MTPRVIGVFGFLGWFFLSASAWAARNGVVDANEVEIREAPNTSAKVIDRVRKGTPITASNLPIEGFHRIRLDSGVIGWIPLNSIILDSAPSPEELLKSGAPRDDDEEDSDEDSGSSSGSQKGKRQLNRNTKKLVRFRLLGGMTFSSLNGIIKNYGSLGQCYSFGGEVVVMVKETVGVVLRAESILNSSVLTDTTTSIGYQVNLKSLPIMVGPEYAVLGRSFSLHFALLAGFTMPTSISSVIVSGTGLGATSLLSSSHFTGLGRINFNWQMTKPVSLFTEVGYRYSLTGAYIPDTTASVATSVYNTSFTINMSGAIAGLGLSIGF